MIIYIVFLSIIACILIVIYIKKYRDLPQTEWKPGAAWTRALIYFAACNLVSAAVGTLEAMLNQPVASKQQLVNPGWILYCIACFSYIFVAYWILWARMTLTFDRKYHVVPEIMFGLLWGFSTGQILLTFYHLWSMLEMPAWAIYLCSYACMGAWQYFIQDYFWDVYVSPEHDTPRSITIKTLVSHVPNVAICLLFLVVYGNYFIFVSTQMFALVATSIFQKFPAPWTKGEFHAPKTKPGILGRSRGAGYSGD